MKQADAAVLFLYFLYAWKKDITDLFHGPVCAKQFSQHMVVDFQAALVILISYYKGFSSQIKHVQPQICIPSINLCPEGLNEGLVDEEFDFSQQEELI